MMQLLVHLLLVDSPIFEWDRVADIGFSESVGIGDEAKGAKEILEGEFLELKGVLAFGRCIRTLFFSL